MKQDNINRVDKGWDRMSMTLNEKMPIKKDRRRGIIFWLWPGLGIAALVITGILLLRNGSTNFEQSEERNFSKEIIAENNIDKKSTTYLNESIEESQSSELVIEETLQNTSYEVNDSNNETSIQTATSNTSETVNHNFPARPSAEEPMGESKAGIESSMSAGTVEEAEVIDTETSLVDADNRVIRDEQNKNDHLPSSPVIESQNRVVLLLPVFPLPVLDLKPFAYTSHFKNAKEMVTAQVNYASISEPIEIPKRDFNASVVISGAGIYAHSLNMGGWHAHAGYQMSFSKFTTGPIVGFGCLRKTSMGSDLLAADIAEMEDQTTSGAILNIENPGEYLNSVYTHTKFIDMGWSNAFRITRGIEAFNVIGYRKYFNSQFDIDESRLSSNISFPEPFNYNLSRESVLFTDFGINIRIHPRWGLNAFYHYEFRDLIEREDMNVNGNAVGMGINFRIN